MIPRPDYQPSAYDDDCEDVPAAGPVPKWIGGVAMPLLLMAPPLTSAN